MRTPVPFVIDLDAPLLALSPMDMFTVRDACNGGVNFLGGPGGGKTTGPGKALAGAYLRAGMGGVVFVAKPEEVPLWLNYAKEHGRENSVVVFDESQGFNFIAYELARQGHQGIGNVTECLMHVLEAADQTTGNFGASQDPFWPQSMRKVLNYLVPVLYGAHGTVTVGTIVDFVTTAATKAEQYSDPQWDSYAARTLRRLAHHPAVPMPADELRSMLEFWFQEWPAIPEKTRGNIVISLSAKLDRFKHGRLKRCFCGETTIVPEMIFQGAIIVMNMPVLTWNEDGIIGQQVFKYLCQRAIESRNGLEPRQRERPVFIWADEAHYFANVKDDEFLSTCRASRACVVFLSQSLPSYYARLGKDKTDAVDGLIGKFATQVFLQNACSRTNEFASKLIGRSLQRRRSQSESRGTSRSRGMNTGSSSNRGSSSSSGHSSGHGGGGFNSSSGSNSSSGESWGDNVGQGSSENSTSGYSEQNDFILEPRFFATQLLCGGPANNFLVTAVWFKTGSSFRYGDGGNFLIPTFRQRS